MNLHRLPKGTIFIQDFHGWITCAPEFYKSVTKDDANPNGQCLVTRIIAHRNKNLPKQPEKQQALL